MPYRDNWRQRQAGRDHYIRNRERVKAAATEWTARQTAALKNIVRREKDKPCPDCGREYPHYVMEFDHVRGEKRNHIAVMAQNGVSVATLMREIAKCEVVCANCHRERTWRRRREEIVETNGTLSVDDDLVLF